ncbi:MAG: glycosyltransferase [Acidobacteria bacterium]|nr:glycosyltransferase [Acidobacteriota bacterium]
MRVLQVGKFYPPQRGGIETVLESISESLLPSADVRVLVANIENRTRHEVVRGVPVTRAASLGTLAATSVCPSFGRWMRRLAGDVIHLHESNPLATLTYLAVRPRGSLIVSFHSEIVRQQRLVRGYGPFRRLLLAHAARILVATPDHLRHSPSLSPFLDKCAVVPFGIDLDRFGGSPDVLRQASTLKERFGSPLVLFVGRHVQYKGVEVLLEAMSKVDATLLIAGDGPMRRVWESSAARDQAVNPIYFLGEVAADDLPALYYASDVLVLPSTNRSEAFGLVQLEAMACGRPVISTRLDSGVGWVNRHGETGLLVEPNDPRALACALRQLLGDPELGRRMGMQGQARAKREFDRRVMGTRLTTIYRDALESNPLAGAGCQRG